MLDLSKSSPSTESPVPAIPVPPVVPSPAGGAASHPGVARTARPDDIKTRLGLGTVGLVLAALLSGGIFAQMWLYRNNELLARETATPLLSPHTFIGSAVGLCFYLMGTFSEEKDLLVMALIGILAVGIINIIWAFKAKTALEHYALRELRVPLHMNSFYTFLLNVYYISYCINDLPNVVHKAHLTAQMVNGQQGNSSSTPPAPPSQTQ